MGAAASYKYNGCTYNMLRHTECSDIATVTDLVGA